MTRRERAVFMLAASLAAIAGIFVAWGAYYRATDEVPARGGSFAEGVIGQPMFVNPLIANGNGPDDDLIELVFAPLGTLAESWNESPDGKSWTATLADGLRWSDGKPLTASDVVFTVETMQDQDARSPQAGAWQGVIAEKTNDREVRFTLREKNAFFGNVAKSLVVAPEHVFGGIPAANIRLSAYNLEPVGSGPYVWKKAAIERDGFIREVRLEPNTEWHGAPALIPDFKVKFYRDSETLIRAFNAKEIDGAGGIDPKDMPSLAIGHKLNAIYLPRYYAIFFNRSTNPALKEKTVRQALSAAIDRKRIVDEVFGGYAAASYGPIVPGMEGYGGNARPETAAESPAAALEREGWLVNPEDGVRYKGAGKDRMALRFDVVVPDIPFLVQAMGIAKGGWKAIGAEADIVVMDPDTVAETALRTRNYQMLLFGNMLRRDPDIYAFWHSSRKFHPGLNLSLYDSPAADALLEAVRRGDGGEAGRNKTLADLQRMIADDAPAAFLVNPAYLYALPEKLGGFSDRNMAAASDRLDGAAAWYRATRRIFK